MFWLNKNKTDNTAGKPGKNNNKAGSETSVGKNAGQPPTSEEIRAQALANAKAARENIGEDTLRRIAAAMTKKQQSATEQAKARIADADADRVAQEILYMMDENA